MESLGDIIRKVAEKLGCTNDEALDQVEIFRIAKKLASTRDAAEILLDSLG